MSCCSTFFCPISMGSRWLGAEPDRGSGLRGLVDRAAAFDGTVSVTDAVPHGTRIVVELRCD